MTEEYRQEKGSLKQHFSRFHTHYIVTFDLLVKDDFFPDALALREDVLSKPFGTVKDAAGIEYSGIQVRDPEEFQESIAGLVGFPVKVNISVARLNFKGEFPANSIHPDQYCGEFAGVGYLTLPGMPFTSTAFWSDKTYGLSNQATPEWLSERGLDEAEYVAKLQREANDAKYWNPDGFVAAKLGRFVTYPTRKLHSRYPFEAFGDSPETGRLIIACFFDRA